MAIGNENVTRGKTKEKNGRPTIGDIGNGGVTHRQTTCFDMDDVEWVYDLLLSHGEPLSIQKIVAMCQEMGEFGYDIDGRQIATMAKAGYLHRKGSLVWVAKRWWGEAA